MNIGEVAIKGWKGYRLTGGRVSAVVVPKIGGRVLSLTYDGQDIMYVQAEHTGETFDFSTISDLCAEKRRLGFRLWGGDKTWISPEREWWGKIPPLELDAGGYQAKIHSDRIEMTSPVCRESGLQITRTVAMRPDGTVRLDQALTNKSQATVHRGIWNVTQLIRPFNVLIATASENVRSYHVEDPTLPVHDVSVDDREGLSCIPCRDNQLFKFGALLSIGQMLCIRRETEGTLAFAKTFDVGPESSYLHRAVVEVFNSSDHDYLEAEVHAPAVPLEPGQMISHSQIWSINRYPPSLSDRQIWEEISRSSDKQ